MTEPEVGMLLSVLSAVYPSMKVNPEVLMAWHFTLKADAPGPIMDAAARLLRTRVSGFPPTPAEILEEVHGADVPTAEPLLVP